MSCLYRKSPHCIILGIFFLFFIFLPQSLLLLLVAAAAARWCMQNGVSGKNRIWCICWLKWTVLLVRSFLNRKHCHSRDVFFLSTGFRCWWRSHRDCLSRLLMHSSDDVTNGPYSPFRKKLYILLACSSFLQIHLSLQVTSASFCLQTISVLLPPIVRELRKRL